jgi:DNA-binding protein H-NS
MKKEELDRKFCMILRDQRRLKSSTNSMAVWDLESAHEKLGRVIAQRREEEDMLLQKEREREQRVEQFKNMLMQEGLSVDDLLETPSKGTKKSKPGKLPMKYEAIDSDGKRVQWTGRGRQPRAIKEALRKGKTLDELKIKSG